MYLVPFNFVTMLWNINLLSIYASRDHLPLSLEYLHLGHIKISKIHATLLYDINYDTAWSIREIMVIINLKKNVQNFSGNIGVLSIYVILDYFSMFTF